MGLRSATGHLGIAIFKPDTDLTNRIQSAMRAVAAQGRRFGITTDCGNARLKNIILQMLSRPGCRRRIMRPVVVVAVVGFGRVVTRVLPGTEKTPEVRQRVYDEKFKSIIFFFISFYNIYYTPIKLQLLRNVLMCCFLY